MTSFLCIFEPPKKRKNKNLPMGYNKKLWVTTVTKTRCYKRRAQPFKIHRGMYKQITRCAATNKQVTLGK